MIKTPRGGEIPSLELEGEVWCVAESLLFLLNYYITMFPHAAWYK
jgi:hypothetical protein